MVTPYAASLASIQGPVSREVPTVERPDKATGGKDFSKSLIEAIEKVDGDIKAADSTAIDFANGKGGIQELALALEQADLSLRLLTRVRNRVIEAYKEISRM